MTPTIPGSVDSRPLRPQRPQRGHSLTSLGSQGIPLKRWSQLGPVEGPVGVLSVAQPSPSFPEGCAEGSKASPAAPEHPSAFDWRAPSRCPRSPMWISGRSPCGVGFFPTCVSADAFPLRWTPRCVTRVCRHAGQPVSLSHGAEAAPVVGCRLARRPDRPDVARPLRWPRCVRLPSGRAPSPGSGDDQWGCSSGGAETRRTRAPHKPPTAVDGQPGRPCTGPGPGAPLTPLTVCPLPSRS